MMPAKVSHSMGGRVTVKESDPSRGVGAGSMRVFRLAGSEAEKRLSIVVADPADEPLQALRLTRDEPGFYVAAE